MVVGLHTYMKQCPTAYYNVDIRQLIDEYRRTGSKKVLVATSGQAIKTVLYQGLNWVCGGAYKEFKQKVKNFVEAFQSIEGVQVIVFYEGATTALKRPVWLERRRRDMCVAIDIFEELRNKSFTERMEQDKFYVPVSLGNFMKYILKLECRCDVRATMGECDEEIAEFGRTNNGFMFIGNDTDYVVYNSFQHFIGIDDLNLDTMTGYKYDTDGLATSLRIPVAQLPIFATLCGNDYIKCFDELQDFHRLLIRQYHTKKNSYRMAVLEAVASYIRMLPQGELLFTVLPTVAQKVFGNRNRAVDLERSIRSYLPSPPGSRPTTVPEISADTGEWYEIVRKARSTFATATSNSIYNILTQQPDDVTSALEDYTEDSDLPITGDLYSLVRRKTFGILLMERPGGPGTVEQWVCTGFKSLEEPSFVDPILPPQDLHPGLLALWGEADGEGQAANEDIADIRWKLFAHTISPNLDVEELRSLVDNGLTHLVVPTVILKYLREALPPQASASSPQYLAPWELEALAIQAVLLKSTDPSRVNVPMPYDARAVHLATIFMRGVSQILMLLASCGFPIPMKEAMPWLFFDGKLFHNKYLGLRNNSRQVESLCVNQDGNSLMQEFLKVKSIALGPLE